MAKISVVGIGPGDGENMTLRAVNALQACDVIVGYRVYVDLIRERFPQKACVATPMRTEVERCRAALELARGGQNVAVVCSGDPGIYGMAGLVYELRGEQADVDIEVVGGLTAACSGGALLGAPLGGDDLDRQIRMPLPNRSSKISARQWMIMWTVRSSSMT